MSTIGLNARWHFVIFFPKQLGIFRLNLTRLLNVYMYARMQIFIELSPTVTKLCHIKCDHPACVSVDGGHFGHIMVAALVRSTLYVGLTAITAKRVVTNTHQTQMTLVRN